MPRLTVCEGGAAEVLGFLGCLGLYSLVEPEWPFWDAAALPFVPGTDAGGVCFRRFCGWLLPDDCAKAVEDALDP